MTLALASLALSTTAKDAILSVRGNGGRGLMLRHLGPESEKNIERRRREGFFEKYFTGPAVLDIGYRGDDPESQPITESAIGIDLDYPGYDGKTLPFPNDSQDTVFASHVLEHIDDWAATLAEWYRVLKLRGHLIIAVPHRDLYERKPTLPSRFNGDHKRFYTPASLLAEIEQALPVGGYRVRSLRDIDDGFDYMIPPERHAAGGYEIELVLQKIAIPYYAALLRPSPVAEAIVAFYATVLRAMLDAAREAGPAEVERIQDSLLQLPLPPYPLLRNELRAMIGPFDQDGRTVEQLRRLLKPLIVRAPFDENWYASYYSDVADALAKNAIISPHQHYIEGGYFEGRVARGRDPIFG
jgi:SAM-dependent methyltransferase